MRGGNNKLHTSILAPKKANISTHPKEAIVQSSSSVLALLSKSLLFSMRQGRKKHNNQQQPMLYTIDE